jgi:hypothetical protein
LSNFNIRKLVLFFGILLSTLINHGLGPWVVGSFLLLSYCGLEGISVSKKSYYETFLLILLLLFGIVHFQFVIFNYVDNVFREAFLGNTFRYILCIIFWYVLRNISLSSKSFYLIDVVAFVLKVHVGVFLVQFVTYFVFEFYIDFMLPFTGEPSRYIGFDSSLIGIGSFRPTGLFAEPSNYSFIVLVLSSLLILFRKFEEHRILIVTAIATMILSFSTAAVFTSFLFILFIIYDLRKFNLLFYVIPLVFLVLAFFPSLYTLSQLQLDRLDGRAGNIRMDLIKQIAAREPDKVVFAYGAYGVERELYLASTNQATGDRVSSLNDAGLLVYMWARFGYVGIAGFFLLCFIMFRVNNRSFFLFLIISLTKISLFYPVFVFYVVLSLASDKKYLQESCR